MSIFESQNILCLYKYILFIQLPVDKNVHLMKAGLYNLDQPNGKSLI